MRRGAAILGGRVSPMRSTEFENLCEEPGGELDSATAGTFGEISNRGEGTAILRTTSEAVLAQPVFRQPKDVSKCSGCSCAAAAFELPS
jgi:hypothetical protein